MSGLSDQLATDTPARSRYPFANTPGCAAILACTTETVCGEHPGGLPERPMGAVCKTVAKASEVRILHPPQLVQMALDLEDQVKGRVVRSHCVSLDLVLAQRPGAYRGERRETVTAWSCPTSQHPRTPRTRQQPPHQPPRSRHRLPPPNTSPQFAHCGWCSAGPRARGIPPRIACTATDTATTYQPMVKHISPNCFRQETARQSSRGSPTSGGLSLVPRLNMAVCRA
jgi:hypothetical protein